MDGALSLAERPLGPGVRLGVLLCALYAALHLALGPLVVDETALSAQILTGAVDYPDGHPHEVFHRQAFSLPNQVSALVLEVSGDIELVSRLRNFLVVFLSAFTPYLVVLVLTRRPLFGFAASALVLTDCVHRFQGVYPTFVFPTFYSHGHVGAYAAIATVALVAGGFARTGAFLVGLFPAVHPLLGALVWLWSAPVAARIGRRPRAGVVLAFAAGLVLTIASFAASRAMAPEYAPGALEEGQALYAVESGGELVRSHFLELTDPHRRMPPPGSGVFLFGYVGNCAAFAALATLLFVALRDASEALRRGTLGLLGFVLLAWAAVWGARLLEVALGGLPAALETAMPYRLSNLSAIALVPLAVAALARTCAARGRGSSAACVAILCALAVGAGAASADELLRPEEYRRAFRLAAGIGLLGAALTAGLVTRDSAARRTAAFVGLAVLLGVFLAQREKSGFQGAELLGAAVVGTMLVLAFAARRDDAPSGVGHVPGRVPLALSVLLCAAATVRSSNAEPSSLVTAFDREVVRWLDESAEPDELLLAPLIPRTQLQVKTGHPVLLELGTLWLMPYLPGVSSVIGRMTRELYGVDYADRAALEQLAPDGYLGQHDDPWKFAFSGRTRAEWSRLGERWDFRIVVAPTGWELPLTPEVVSVEWTLYTIPAR